MQIPLFTGFNRSKLCTLCKTQKFKRYPQCYQVHNRASKDVGGRTNINMEINLVALRIYSHKDNRIAGSYMDALFANGEAESLTSSQKEDQTFSEKKTKLHTTDSADVNLIASKSD